MMNIQYVTSLVAAWVKETFGNASLMDRKNRAMRVVEEAIELAQAEGVEQGLIHRIMNRTYNRPVGKPEQEAAGVFFTLLAWGHAANVNVGNVLMEELDRVQKIDPEHFRAKQREKFEEGTDIALPIYHGERYEIDPSVLESGVIWPPKGSSSNG